MAAVFFHQIQEKPGPYTVSLKEFRETLDSLQRAGYVFIALDQFLAFVEGRGDVPPGAVLLAADDGYEGIYSLAFPALKARRIPLVVFPITKWLAPVRREELHLPKVSPEQLRLMAASGLVAVGSHTHEGHSTVGGQPYYQARLHSPWTGRPETGDERRARIWNDLVVSRAVLEEIVGRPPSALSLPFGCTGREVREAARRAGFRCIFAGREGLVDRKTDLMDLPRVRWERGPLLKQLKNLGHQPGLPRYKKEKRQKQAEGYFPQSSFASFIHG
ncbi:MAG: polysaccharide deacetylase family protein [Firmicutes bacterium]|nr:polysaccharide deacetylase family protein [Bacillota bacterium]